MRSASCSDTHGGDRGLEAECAGHETISHRDNEYVRGPASINVIEGFWANARERLSAITGGRRSLPVPTSGGGSAGSTDEIWSRRPS